MSIQMQHGPRCGEKAFSPQDGVNVFQDVLMGFHDHDMDLLFLFLLLDVVVHYYYLLFMR